MKTENEIALEAVINRLLELVETQKQIIRVQNELIAIFKTIVGDLANGA